MAVSLADCARFLRQQGLRHHVDEQQGLIRLVFVTQCYRNLRDEKLAIITVETPADGQRVRAEIVRAFAPGSDPAAVCLAACRLAADTPLVAAEFDADFEDLRLVIETIVEDGSVTALQMVAMIDRLVEAAEAWWPTIAATHTSIPDDGGFVKKRGAA